MRAWLQVKRLAIADGLLTVDDQKSTECALDLLELAELSLTFTNRRNLTVQSSNWHPTVSCSLSVGPSKLLLYTELQSIDSGLQLIRKFGTTG